MTENAFIQLVHAKLDSSVYREKTNNPFRSGMPDVYYEGPKGILWVEYKWIKALWNADRPRADICKTRSWIAQHRWLDRATQHGVRAFVVVGVGQGRQALAYVLSHPYDFTVAENQPVTIQQLRTWILEQTT